MATVIRGDDNFDTADNATQTELDSGLAGLTTGKILQVQSVIKSDTASHSSDTWTDISGLSVNITPSSTSSKIVIMVSASICGNGGAQFLRLNRVAGSGDVIALPTSPSSRSGVFIVNEASGHGNGLQTFANSYVDSPNTTAQCTYKIQWRWQGGVIYLNRSRDDTDNVNFPRGVSNITVMEISG